MQSPAKPQFATWLIEQVCTGEYAGLCYVDQNRFRVPWKHNSRKDCNDEDTKIFKAWAVASGKFIEYPNNKAKWKTNFRCALNSLGKHFKMVTDNSKYPEDPHKIYEIVNSQHNYESHQQPDYSPDDHDMTPDIYSSPIEYLPSDNEQNLLQDFSTLDINSQMPDEQQWAETYVQQNPDIAVSYSAIHSSTVEPQAMSQNHAALVPEQPYYQATPEPVLQPPINSLEVIIHYRRKEVLRTQLTCNRLQLHYKHEDPHLNAHPLCFPTTDGLLDRKQIDFTNRILNSIQRGLLLEVRDNGIYAHRQDRCHVFVSTCDTHQAHPDPRKLPQDTTVEILRFDKYADELRQFSENNGPSPQYVINMCFGEKFPDGRPLERKLITVKVVPLICRYFHEMAQVEGASSLHSANVSLQISHNSLYDLIGSIFSLPTADGAPQVAEDF